MAIASGDRIKPRPGLAPQRVGRLPPLPLRSNDRPTQILGYPEAGHPVPSLTGYDLFRYTAIWLTIGALIEPISGPKRVWLLFPLFVGGVLIAKVMMVDTTLTTAEIAGAALAFCAWSVLAVHVRLGVFVIALLFCGYVIAERLEPFQFGSTSASFRLFADSCG